VPKDGDNRMAYEKSCPFSVQMGGSEEYRKNFDAIDWTDGKPNQAKKRKTYPRPKGYGQRGF
jgi:hypothetical protein